eukprot:CAMPEP_0168329464 /NCGR_PEP_ID=MMETSP0213-20121227/7125_1 /TAXON_ID=151035 /ORGANISM="Euplotes harpa, Strain FSP1.4" /LENGTH=68 /DNA_ID=CAMNT_0008332797 /DNA_START=1464 /DNA_END=1670 /DNA_ORIENTATION=+
MISLSRLQDKAVIDGTSSEKHFFVSITQMISKSLVFMILIVPSAVAKARIEPMSLSKFQSAWVIGESE